VGCGAIAEKWHAKALKAVGWKPCHLVDKDETRTGALHRAFPRATVHRSHEDILGEVDFAIIAVPHKLHAPIATQFLENGAHVFVEKPMATSADECASLLETMQETNRHLAVGLMRRFSDGARAVKAFMETGALGPITRVEAREGGPYGWPIVSKSFWAPESGGVLLDTGAHTLDLLAWWLGEPDVVRYQDDSYGGVEAECRIELSFSGASGLVELSRTRSLSGMAVIEGENGCLQVDLVKGTVEATPGSLLGGRSIKATGFADLYKRQARDLLRVAKTGEAPEVSGESATASVSIIEKCYARRERLELPWVQPMRTGERSEVEGLTCEPQ